jgi:hypothetical protein
MMAKDVDRICKKYEVKLDLGRASARVDGNRERQVAAFRRSVEKDRTVREAVAAVLCAEGISTIWWSYYYAFGRKLAWLKSHWGETLVMLSEARIQVDVWTARGLARPVLERIATECFELDLGGPIPALAQSEEGT